MLRGIVLTALLIDSGLVVGRVLTYPAVFAIPDFTQTIGFLAVSLGAAGVFTLWAIYSNLLRSNLRLATATGVVGGVILVVHMALENFGSRIGDDWRLTVVVMLGTFALWFSSGWWSSRVHSTPIAGAAAGGWTALVSIFLAVTFGFIGTYLDVPSSEYVATWPEFIQSGSSDPKAFAIVNAFDAATSHIATALILGSILGGAGWLMASLQKGPGLKSRV